jgi:hypothetical protein
MIPTEWLANEKRTVKPADWSKLEMYLWVDSTKDFLLRIDDEQLTSVPSTLFIRNLSVVEENTNRTEMSIREE